MSIFFWATGNPDSWSNITLSMSVRVLLDEIRLFLLINFFIEGKLLSRIFLFSVKPQHESAIGTHISPVHIYPLPFETPSYLPPCPTPLDWYRDPVWASWATQQTSVGYFTYGNVSFHITLSIHLTRYPHVHKSALSVSQLLPCK